MNHPALSAQALPAPAPDALHPQVWRGRELAQAPQQVLPTGHAALDAQLPGGGWPLGQLVEVLQDHPAQHVWQLFLPALRTLLGAQDGPLALVAPPYLPFGPALQGEGLAAHALLCIEADSPAARLWAAEQALACADVQGVLAWLPQARPQALRRLHLVAQRTQRLLVAFRPQAAAQEASPAALRLAVGGQEALQVRILKRRGPPLAVPVLLPAHPQRLRQLLAARRGRPAPVPPVQEIRHALDRAPSLAQG